MKKACILAFAALTLGCSQYNETPKQGKPVSLYTSQGVLSSSIGAIPVIAKIKEEKDCLGLVALAVAHGGENATFQGDCYNFPKMWVAGLGNVKKTMMPVPQTTEEAQKLAKQFKIDPNDFGFHYTCAARFNPSAAQRIKNAPVRNKKIEVNGKDILAICHTSKPWLQLPSGTVLLPRLPKTKRIEGAKVSM